MKCPRRNVGNISYDPRPTDRVSRVPGLTSCDETYGNCVISIKSEGVGHQVLILLRSRRVNLLVTVRKVEC